MKKKIKNKWFSRKFPTIKAKKKKNPRRTKQTKSSGKKKSWKNKNKNSVTSN